ncbi:unnamed protein product [Macrosiphum euphorbiae]|uniref:BACK domain-containing protein n=1 Tax=Macrosiphum euphorbiae TaxID=13131 RepID=A0AAV0X6W0_9HEMI|nr:unnamed protein product [Macrosiphum euphorbiae]
MQSRGWHSETRRHLVVRGEISVRKHTKTVCEIVCVWKCRNSVGGGTIRNSRSRLLGTQIIDAISLLEHNIGYLKQLGEGQIRVTEENVLGLLPAADLLQLQGVKDACCDFLQSQLCPTNCIGINTLADLHSCKKLITRSEIYIHQHFSEVFGGDEFLSLSSEQVIKLISNNRLPVSSDEKVFESVISWVKYDLGSRQCILPQLMEHVRLPLTSKEYILKNVIEEPLILNCFKCYHYGFEALNTINSEEFIPQIVRNIPRHGEKVLLVIGGNEFGPRNSLEWFDPRTDQWHFGPELITDRCVNSLVVINDNFVFDVGCNASHRSVYMLDLSSESPCWQPSVDMLVERRLSGFGVINDKIYAVGGLDDMFGNLQSAEVFDYNTQAWRMICSMTSIRSSFGVGVLNELLYVVGGHDEYRRSLDTVECYNPSMDMWRPVANMRIRRSCAGVGVLNGVLYAVGGHDGSDCLSSVEAYKPSTGVWTSIADMIIPRKYPEAVALDGLLYVVGGLSASSFFDSVECYNPNTNTWAMVTAKCNILRILPGVVTINRPLHFTTYEHL